MVKKISFLPEFIPLIKEGTKTVTRRVKKKNTGVYYFTGGRTGKKEGYILIIRCEPVKLANSFYISYACPAEPINPRTRNEVRLEGIDSLVGFISLWDKLTTKKYRWPKYRAESFEIEDPLIYRIEFKYIGEGYEQNTMARLLV